MKFLARVSRTIVETVEIEIEAPDEDSAWQIAEDAAAQVEPQAWESDCAGIEVNNLEEIN